MDYGSGFYRVLIRYGFMEEVNVPAELAKLKGCGPACKMMDTSFFLARQTLIASARPGMGLGAKAVRLDVAQCGKRDGVFQAADQPRRRTRQPGRNLNRTPPRGLRQPWKRSSVGSRPLRRSPPR